MPDQVPLRVLLALTLPFVAVSFVFVSIYVFTQHAPRRGVFESPS